MMIGSCSAVRALLLASSLMAAASASYDNYLLSCGATGTTRSTWDDRTWQSDNSDTFSTKFRSTVSASTAAHSPGAPFSTARVFNSSFTYSFRVSPGPKFIRLFFNPSYTSPYVSSSASLSLPATDAYLTVRSSSDHVLLHNFSASSFDCSRATPYFNKEFLVHVADSRLQLTFIPTSSFAFINGIEVVSVPEALYLNNPAHTPKNVDQEAIPFELGNSAALETAYRVNAGGTEVSLRQDSGNMFRRWETDEPYLRDFHGQRGFTTKGIKYPPETPTYSAPTQVYGTMRWMGPYLSFDDMNKVNVTWNFQVDLGMHYLVRLHWCEISAAANSIDFRVFDVYLNYLMADRGVDIYGWANGAYNAIYKDYVVYMDGQNRGALHLSMHINTDKPHRDNDILLNGLEIFKINRSDGSLGASNPSCPTVPTPISLAPSKSASGHIVPVIIGVIAGAIVLAFLFCVLLFQRQKLWKTSSASSETTSTKPRSKWLLGVGKSDSTQTSHGGSSSSLPTHLCRRFTLEEIRLATSDLHDSLILGRGGFGNVYRGAVATEAGYTPVAIKRLNPLSSQGAEEFKMEIGLLSKLRHVNLVSLIGYCDDAREMILVYEYMSRGTLRDHLYLHSGFDVPEAAHLSWRRRLEICLGAARGLHYLHTGTDRTIIHRDVKSTNILLDDRWDAKVSDFGLSKMGPVGDELSHISTAVKGSFGYMDPEYYRRLQLTIKSDVYSFGVVLFEVLCGRAAVNQNLPKEQVNLPIWGRRNQTSGTLDAIVDPAIKGEIVPECLRKFGEVAESCVRDEGAHRPSMADVIGGLELALRLQLESSVTPTIYGGQDFARL